MNLSPFDGEPYAVFLSGVNATPTKETI